MEKKIHYCWFGGKKLPSSVKKCIETWKKFLPDYEIIEWNESNFDINKCTFVKKAYENKKWAFVSDYVRIYALYTQGGIYFDTDLKIIKNVSNITNKDVFLGYEDSGYVGTAVIGVKEKENPFIKKILDYYNKIQDFNVDIIYNYANPLIITKTLKEYKSKIDENGIEIFNDNIYVYPRDYFYPISYDYRERIFTKNTCMVHLFKATWTDKKDKRVVRNYKFFGPKWGRRINTAIDNLVNLKYKFIAPASRFYHFARLKASIYLNVNRRVNKIKAMLENIKEDYIIISNPDLSIEKNKIIGFYGKQNVDIREQYTQKEARKIASEIIKSNKKIVIFNSYTKGWEMIIQALKEIKPKIIVKMINHGGIENWEDANNWTTFSICIKLYNKRLIDEIIVCHRNKYDFLCKKGYKVKLLKQKIEINDIEKYKKDKKTDKIKIGLYRCVSGMNNNVFNQMCAVSLLENAVLDCEPINMEMSAVARMFNINLTGSVNYLERCQIYSKMAENDVNLFVKSIEDDSILPIKSFELGKVCVIGKNSYFLGTEIEKEIRVSNPTDSIEIYKKIVYVLENKEKILKLYDRWKKENKPIIDASKEELVK